jgi:hypothetical protein
MRPRGARGPSTICDTCAATHQIGEPSQHPGVCHTSQTPIRAPLAPTAPSRSTEMPSDLSQHPAACHRALQTTELLENILVHLPVKDLFVHQKVSKRFQATIAKSPAIRRKMFLRLSNTPREYWKYVCQHRWDGRQRRLAKLAFEVADPTTTIPRDEQLVTPVALNPILEVFSTSTRQNLGCIRRKFFNRSHHEHVRLEAPEQSVVGRHSSLLATFISDPPCKVAKVSMTLTIQTTRTSMRPQYQPHSFSSKMITVQSDTGLKLSDLWDTALDAPGDYRWKSEYGIIRSRPVASFRNVLNRLREPSTFLSGMMDIELCDVVVPTPEEWAAVR